MSGGGGLTKPSLKLGCSAIADGDEDEKEGRTKDRKKERKKERRKERMKERRNRFT
jgi:hypothetical protein